jgi:hypothetical protein
MQKTMYTSEEIATIKHRARRHTPTYIDPNYLMIEQLLNIITQYEDNMPKWMKESDNA